MKKFAFALIATVAVFGATTFATPAQASTYSPHIIDPTDNSERVIEFDHYPPSVYTEEGGYVGYLINVRILSNGWYEGTYLAY